MRRIAISRFRYLLIFLVMFGSATVNADENSIESFAVEGKKLLKLMEYDKARKSFALGQKLAKERGDSDWNAKFMFYQGNTYLLEASADGNADTANEIGLAKKAVRIFHYVVKLLPQSGTSKVNLARAYALLGDDKEVDALYQQAIALKGKEEYLFQQQYAAFLSKRNPGAAAKQLHSVIAAEPKNLKAHRELMQIYQDPIFSKDLYKYLIGLIKRGEVIRAQNSAFDVLAKPDWPKKSQADMLIVIASSFAKQHIGPSEFRKSKELFKLRNVARTHIYLRPGVSELLKAMSGGKAVTFKWWTSDRERTNTISVLLRSLGRYYDQINKPIYAEKLYERAVKLKGAEDPTAMRDLVDFYSKRGDLKKIDDISRKYERRLYKGKGLAYQSGDVVAIYDYHRTLASIYSFQANKTGDWGSASQVNSATFQLERAFNTAKENNSITPDTKLIDNLAQSYQSKGESTKAIDVRFTAAEMYTSKGEMFAAEKVLKTVKVTDLSQIQKGRYDQIRKPLRTSTQSPVNTPNESQIEGSKNQIYEPPNQLKQLKGPDINLKQQGSELEKILSSPELLKQRAMEAERAKEDGIR